MIINSINNFYFKSFQWKNENFYFTKNSLFLIQKRTIKGSAPWILNRKKNKKEYSDYFYLNAYTRIDTGRTASKRFKSKGWIPAKIYGKNSEDFKFLPPENIVIPLSQVQSLLDCPKQIYGVPFCLFLNGKKQFCTLTRLDKDYRGRPIYLTFDRNYDLISKFKKQIDTLLEKIPVSPYPKKYPLPLSVENFEDYLKEIANDIKFAEEPIIKKLNFERTIEEEILLEKKRIEQQVLLQELSEKKKQKPKEQKEKPKDKNK